MSENELLHLFFRFAVAIVSFISFVNLVRWRSRAKGECKMGLIDESSKQKSEGEIKPTLSRGEIVEKMYEKYPDDFSDDVVDVIYSKDRSMRYVITKDGKGFYTYELEQIYQYDEDEWRYICSNNKTVPATWLPSIGYAGIDYRHFFENIDELLREMKAEPEYKKCFE